jgi:hypothetical protein
MRRAARPRATANRIARCASTALARIQISRSVPADLRAFETGLFRSANPELMGLRNI